MKTLGQGMAALVATSLLVLAGCEPPPEDKPLLSQNDVGEIINLCLVPSSVIKPGLDKVTVRTRGLSKTAASCVLREVRIRLPNTPIIISK